MLEISSGRRYIGDNDIKEYRGMMNRFEGSGSREAKIRYLDGDFQILLPGGYVTCAISGKQIPIDELKYWSVDRQQPYADAESSFEAERLAGNLPGR